MSDEPSIEVMMLTRFLEAASPHDILRWHKAEMKKAISASRLEMRLWLREHGYLEAADAVQGADPTS